MSDLGDTLRQAMKLAGEQYEIKRAGNTYLMEGLKNSDRGRKYIAFYPNTDVQSGDWLRGTTSGDEFYVVDTSKQVIQGKVYQIRAFYETKVEHDTRVSRPRDRVSSSTQTINIHGGTVNVAQTHSGSVSQKITGAASDVTEVKRLLRDLEAAIHQLKAPEEEREAFVTQIEQLRGEVSQPKPVVARLLAGWGAVNVFATTESAWQGWERIQHISVELAPKIQHLIETFTSQ